MWVFALIAGIGVGGGCSDDGGDNNPLVPRVPTLEQITQADHFHGNPIFSPDGNWLLYESDASGNMDLYRIPVAGGTAQQLTFDPGFDSSGTWFGDGSQIAFESDRSGRKHIYVLILDTPLAQPVAVTDGDCDDGSPMYSPDGSRIVFESNRGKNPGSDLWTVSAWGGAATRVTTTGDGIYNRTADWSPDGRELVYESNRADVSALYRVPVSGGETTQVSLDDGYEGHPSWSPDGATVVYESNATGRLEIYALPAVGGESQRLTTQGGSWPRYSRDGTRIVFGVLDGEKSSIWIMEVDF